MARWSPRPASAPASPTGSFIGGNSENFRGGKQFQLSPKLDRYNINVLGHFDVSEAFTPFFEAKYSRTDSSGTGSSGPAFTQGADLGDPAAVRLRRPRTASSSASTTLPQRPGS